MSGKKILDGLREAVAYAEGEDTGARTRMWPKAKGRKATGIIVLAPAAAEERARIVAWLRNQLDGDNSWDGALLFASDAIERGEHETEGGR